MASISERRLALSAELDNVVQKRPNDHKWFDLGADAKLTLRDRPEDLLAIIYEIAARVWQWVTSFFDDTPSLLERRIVLLTTQVDDYLSEEPNLVERSRFLLKYSVCLNELYRAAEKMGRAGKISLASTHAVEEIRTGVKRGSGLAPTATSCLVTARYEEGRYHPTSKIKIKSLLDQNRTVSFEFANAGIGSRFEGVFLRQNETRDVELDRSGHFERVDAPATVTAFIKNRTTIPLLNQNYEIEIDHRGRMRVEPKGIRPQDTCVTLNFRNRGDKEVSVAVPYAAGVNPDDPTVPRFSLAPGETRDVGPKIEDKEYEIATFVKTAKEELTLGYNRGQYVCQVDANGILFVLSERQRVMLRPILFTVTRPLTYMITFRNQGNPILQTLPFDPKQTEAQFVVENCRENNMEFYIKFDDEEEGRRTKSVFLAPNASTTCQMPLLGDKMDCSINAYEFPDQ